MAKDGASHQTSPDGERVADLAADLLRRAADLSDSLARDNPDRAEDFRSNAETYRIMAERVAQDPRGDVVRSGAHARFSDQIDFRTERRWSHAEIGVRMLRDAAVLVDNVAAAQDDGDDGRRELAEIAETFRHGALMLSVAPEAWMDDELKRLTPYLMQCGLVQEGLPIDRAPPRQRERLMQLPAFLSVAARTFEIFSGRAFDTLPDQAKEAWAANLGQTWVRLHGPPPQPLSADEREALAFAVQKPRADWVQPPLLSGEWTDLPPSDAIAVMTVIGEVERVGAAEMPLVLHHYCDRVRTRPLQCHGGLLMAELQGYGPDGRAGIISVLLPDEGAVVADGSSTPIFDLNDRCDPALVTPAARLDYLNLFLNWVRGSDGRFQPVEHVGALDGRLSTADWGLRHLGDIARPLAETGEDEGGWILTSPIAYGGAVFNAAFRLTSTGVLEMIEDDVILTDVPLRPEIQDGALLCIADEPDRQP